MAYPVPDPAAPAEYLLDIASRREYYGLRAQPPIDTAAAAAVHGYAVDAAAVPALPGLRLHAPQVFVSMLASPSSPVPRHLVLWAPGSGKSIAGIGAILATIRERPGTIVHVLSFTGREVFLAEMLRHPELGFVSAAEAASLKAIAQARANTNDPTIKREFATTLGRLTRRLTDASRGGIFRFLGYREFAYDLFSVTRAGVAKKFDLRKLYDRNTESGEAKKDIYDLIEDAVRSGYIRVNQRRLAELRDGFLLADEIHETYNVQSSNNYGRAIMYALTVLGDHAPRCVYLSATPVKGSATEITDVLNLLVPRGELPGGVLLRRDAFFTVVHQAEVPAHQAAMLDDEEEAAPQATVELQPGALEQIQRLSLGRVSYLLDTDVLAYPRVSMPGVHIRDIPYLSFTMCDASPEHRAAVEALLRQADAERAVLHESIYDIVYPGVDGGAVAAADPVALWAPVFARAREGDAAAERSVAAAAVELLSGPENGLPPGATVLGGAWLGLPRLATYSAKYATVVRRMQDRLRTQPGRMIVYHNRVRKGATLQIYTILRYNGFIGEVEMPNDSTLCSRCGVSRRDHVAVEHSADGHSAASHTYMPARVLVAHSDVDDVVLRTTMARFDEADNLHGERYVGLVGSRKIRQSYNFRCVRELDVCSLPNDISTLMQVLGRVNRKNSHIALPEAERTVEQLILVTNFGPPRTTTSDEGGPELRRYAAKMREYLVIQQVYRALTVTAVDAFANYPRMLSADPTLATRDTLASLAYAPLVPVQDVDAAKLQYGSWLAYGAAERSVEALRQILLVLFGARPVWTYNDLWACVRSNVVRGVADDPALTAEGAFASALAELGRPYSPAAGVPPRVVVRLAQADAPDDDADLLVWVPVGYDGAARPDYELYGRRAPPAPRVRVALGAPSRAAQALDARFAALLQKVPAVRPLVLLLTDAPRAFHVRLLRRLIEAAAEGQVVVSADTDAELRKMYRAFNLFVRAPGQKADTAFRDQNGVQAWRDGRWHLDAPSKYGITADDRPDNPHVVGIVADRADDEMAQPTFKLRPSAAANTARDARKQARGAACETRPRGELAQLARRIATPRDDLSQASGLCQRMRLLLLGREAEARRGEIKPLRWLYLFNDRAP